MKKVRNHLDKLSADGLLYCFLRFSVIFVYLLITLIALLLFPISIVIDSIESLFDDPYSQ